MGKELILDKSNTVVELKNSDSAIAPFSGNLERLRQTIKITETHLGLNIVRYLIATLNSKGVRTLREGSIEQHLYAVRKLINYLDTFEWDESTNDDLTVFNIEFLKHLEKKLSTGKATQVVWNRYLALIRKGRSSVEACKYKNSQITDLLENGKSFTIRSEPLPTLCQLFPELGIENDKALLAGCIEVMVWLLNEFTYLRQLVEDHLPEEVENHLDLIKAKRITLPKKHVTTIALDELDDDNANFCGYFTKTMQIYDGGYTAVPLANIHSQYLRTLLSIEDSVLKEIVFDQIFQKDWYFENGIDADQEALVNEIEELFRHRNTNGKIKKITNSAVPHFKKSKLFPELNNRTPGRLSVTPISFLFSHTELEVHAMQWLLAAGRSQVSGLEKLSVSRNVDWKKDRGTIQIVNVQKNRRQDLSKGQHSDIFRRNEPQYDVLVDWVKLIAKSQEYISNIDDKFFLYQQNGAEWSPQRDGILRLLATKGSKINSKIKSAYKGHPKEEAVRLFLRILNNHCSLCKDRSINRKSKEKKSLPKRQITTQVIAQTRAIIFEEESDYNLVGHDPETHQEIYLKRTTSPYVQSKIAYWASAIGNAYIEEAQSLYSNTRSLSVKEAKTVLKMKDFNGQSDIDEIQEIIDKAESDGFVTDLAGILNSNEKNIVLMTPMTCALILARINHIQHEVSQIEISNRSKVYKLITELIYLNLVADQFSEDMVNAAKEINTEYEFPFARMV